MSSSFQVLKSAAACHLGEWTEALSQGRVGRHSYWDVSVHKGTDVKVSRRNEVSSFLGRTIAQLF